MVWTRIGLRPRLYILLTALVLITLVGGLSMVWYTYRIEDRLTAIIDSNIAAYQASESLEIALVNQKGFVSYYFIDNDPGWLRQLGEYRQIFRDRLQTASSTARSPAQQQAIERIADEYDAYVAIKDRVIAHYMVGERQAGADLHSEARSRFFNLLDLCEAYKSIHTQSILDARRASHIQAQHFRFIAVVAMLSVFLLGLLLALVLVKQILGPVQKLAMLTDRTGGRKDSEDVIKALSQGVQGLMEDIHQTYSQLEKSQENLLQAEKMALVGKLAAGMAHSIRNPLTSVKMRLFSLGRMNTDLSEAQKDDFEVIAEEIRHIDTIVQNFLEFSRPPKLTMQRISPSEVVDLVRQLLAHRLESYQVTMTLMRTETLPQIQADPEQLKEVLVNLVENACEAMGQGGQIAVREQIAQDPELGKVAVIRLTDNGPGMSPLTREKIFQPFFTTKEEGTGLGLSIAARIIAEHRGKIEVESIEGDGTTFHIALPIKETSGG